MSDADRGWTPTLATRQRLLAVVPELLGPAAAQELMDAGAGEIASALAERIRAAGTAQQVWLLLCALAGRYPNADLVQSVHRRLRLAEPEQALTQLLEAAWPLGVISTGLESSLEVVVDQVLVDVDFCAKHSLNTGIQRVVREVMPRWTAMNDVQLVCWTEGDDAYRALERDERERVLEWRRVSRTKKPSEPDGLVPEGPAHMIVPLRSVVVLAEVTAGHLAPAVSALARYSGNAVVAIGYDTIPIGSADSMPAAESEKFTQYLSVIKHVRRVAGISRSAADEFAGFAAALPAQGLTGPEVGAVPLAVDVPSGHDEALIAPGTDPLVLVVGSRDERKNGAAVLAAAERLHSEGLALRLRFIGGGKSHYAQHIEREARRLARVGLRVEILAKADDATLMDSYRRARFTVFPSTHEGYGLPVAESLALGVPALTADFGSTREIAETGGAIVVDPRDDEALLTAMRSLLTDDALIVTLRQESAARSSRTWDDYSGELWDALVAPLRRDSP